MPQFNLLDARLKLKRAGEHILDVERAVENLSTPDLYSVSMQRDERAATISVNFESLHDSDNHISTIIGDAIGNLRSALDYLMGAIVKPLGGDPTNVTFPFAKDQKGFTGEVRAESRKLTSELITIFDKIEAYKGGAGHNLWAVNQLAGIKASWVSGGSTYINCVFAVKAGQKGHAIEAPEADFKFTSKPAPVFHIQFEELGVAEYTEVLPFLHLAASDINSVLQSIENN